MQARVLQRLCRTRFEPQLAYRRLSRAPRHHRQLQELQHLAQLRQLLPPMRMALLPQQHRARMELGLGVEAWASVAQAVRR